jgi:hypothetical protein
MTTFTIPTETITENLTLITTETTSIITTILHTITTGHKGNRSIETVTITETAGTSEGINATTEVEQVFGFVIFLLITTVIEWLVLRCRTRTKIETAYSDGQKAGLERERERLNIAKREGTISQSTLV